MNTTRYFLAGMMTLNLAGCGMFDTVTKGASIDYKSSGKLPSLEVPPDLIKPAANERYNIPENSRGTATLSDYQHTREDTARSSGQAGVLPTVEKAHIERSGSQRWLVVNRSPEELWPLIREFWQQAGFLINMDSPETGIMETDWAENRAKIPQDLIRSTIGKLFDSLYSTSERDKFRTRLEKTAQGTEIFISHRGVVEVYDNNVEKNKTVWQPRPSDPELEAEFLRRLMLVLGTENAQDIASAAENVQQEHASLIRTGSGLSGVRVNEGFDRAWRRVGLALDRVGFTVEDRDRSKGLYFVRYVDPLIDSANAEKEKGFLGKIFSFGKKEEKPTEYRISVAANASVEQATEIQVQGKDGKPEHSDTVDRILKLLYDQLK
ncbi:MAG: outer membrane protein assembly factor BamC [Burkholderiaceae bacterium]|nr:MAG: outer membrane protein assembly factor BamC [Burkholderiaceae bacterium]